MRPPGLHLTGAALLLLAAVAIPKTTLAAPVSHGAPTLVVGEDDSRVTVTVHHPGKALRSAASAGELTLTSSADDSTHVFLWTPPASHGPERVVLAFWNDLPGVLPDVATTQISVTGQTD